MFLCLYSDDALLSPVYIAPSPECDASSSLHTHLGSCEFIVNASSGVSRDGEFTRTSSEALQLAIHLAVRFLK